MDELADQHVCPYCHESPYCEQNLFFVKKSRQNKVLHNVLYFCHKCNRLWRSQSEHGLKVMSVNDVEKENCSEDLTKWV